MYTVGLYYDNDSNTFAKILISFAKILIYIALKYKNTHTKKQISPPKIIHLIKIMQVM